MSYEKYLKMGLEQMSSNLTVRTYKLAPKVDYPIFERGRDLRVQVFWKKESKYEFIVEKTFWYQSNRNKDDREWMRAHADVTLKMFKDAIVKKPKKKVKVKSKTSKVRRTQGFTQDAFEKMKSK